MVNLIPKSLGGGNCFSKYVKAVNGTILTGYQLRYIYFIDKSYRKRLAVPEIPFSRIDEMGAGMYKGENVTRAERNVECEAQKKKEESV